MPDDPFDALDAAVRSGGPDACFELLLERFREEKKYSLVFDARAMQSRHALGMPLVQNGSLENLPAATRAALERSYVEAARSRRAVPG